MDAGTSSSPVEYDMIGQHIGRFVITEKLGEGGFGKVYRARSLDASQEDVAIKVADTKHAKDPRFVAAMFRESQHIHRLHHPGIVGFKQFWYEEDGLVVIVMELLEGRTLRREMLHRFKATGTSRLLVPEAMDALEAILEALAYAHEHGVVHRDIKPSNVFWCADGKFKLMDFGLAGAAQRSHWVQRGWTPRYTSPERFKGQVPPAVDIYAAGLVAWEMLAGRPACKRRKLEQIVDWHLTRRSPPVRRFRPDCPQWLSSVIWHLTEPDLELRPKNGSDAFSLFWSAKVGKPIDGPDPGYEMDDDPLAEPTSHFYTSIKHRKSDGALIPGLCSGSTTALLPADGPAVDKPPASSDDPEFLGISVDPCSTMSPTPSAARAPGQAQDPPPGRDDRKTHRTGVSPTRPATSPERLPAPSQQAPSPPRQVQSSQRWKTILLVVLLLILAADILRQILY